MLDAFKQLLGLAPRDNREVWHDTPLVIMDADDIVVFSGMATIEYTPTSDEYERGHATIFDSVSGAHLMDAEIVRQLAYSSLDSTVFYWTRAMRFGVTARGTDESGRQLTFFIGRHAQCFLLRTAGSVLEYSADVTMTFPEDDGAKEE